MDSIATMNANSLEPSQKPPRHWSIGAPGNWRP